MVIKESRNLCYGIIPVYFQKRNPHTCHDMVVAGGIRDLALALFNKRGCFGCMYKKMIVACHFCR